MKQLVDMDREELLEVIRIKDALIRELREELSLYQSLAQELQKKLGQGK